MKTKNVIIPIGMVLEKHEVKTAQFLAKYGKVEFILPSRTKGVKNKDIVFLNQAWEMKCPRGNSKNTIFNAIRRGIKQSNYIIIDLRSTPIPTSTAIRNLKYSIKLTQNIKRILLITKDGNLLELDKNVTIKPS